MTNSQAANRYNKFAHYIYKVGNSYASLECWDMPKNEKQFLVRSVFGNRCYKTLKNAQKYIDKIGGRLIEKEKSNV